MGSLQQLQDNLIARDPKRKAIADQLTADFLKQNATSNKRLKADAAQAYIEDIGGGSVYNAPKSDQIYSADDTTVFADQNELQNGKMVFDIKPSSQMIPLDKIRLQFTLELLKKTGINYSAVDAADKLYLKNAYLLALLNSNLKVYLKSTNDSVNQNLINIHQDDQDKIMGIRMFLKNDFMHLDKNYKKNLHCVKEWCWSDKFGGTDAADFNKNNGRNSRRDATKTVTFVEGTIQKLGNDWANEIGKAGGREFIVPLRAVNDLFKQGHIPPGYGMQISFELPSETDQTKYIQTIKKNSTDKFVFRFNKTTVTQLIFEEQIFNESALADFNSYFSNGRTMKMSNFFVIKVSRHNVHKGHKSFNHVPIPGSSYLPSMLLVFIEDQNNRNHTSMYDNWDSNLALELLESIQLHNGTLFTITKRQGAGNKIDFSNDTDMRCLARLQQRFFAAKEIRMQSDAFDTEIMNGEGTDFLKIYHMEKIIS